MTSPHSLLSVQVIEPETSSALHLVQAPAPGTALALWAAEGDLAARARQYPALLLRGFSVGGRRGLAAAAAAAGYALLNHYGDLPEPDRAVPGIRSATPYPSDRAILFHNEGSHTDAPPRHIWFHSESVAPDGGATPLVDGIVALERLPRRLRTMFADHGLRYVRNFIPGLDVPWQAFFGTDAIGEVEILARSQGFEADWRADGTLRIASRCPAVVAHPDSGSPTFFNQVLLHHPALVDPPTRRALLALFGPSGLPRSVEFGDGSPLNDADVYTVLGVLTAEAWTFRWQEDDVLIVDNIALAHARQPYVGNRRMNVAPGRFPTERAPL
jgi:alpha-ketoglutarate-dependent taurine dioxygenase